MSDVNDDSSLADVTNKLAATGVVVRDEAAIKRVKEADWSVPEKYNYDSYNAGNKEEYEALIAAQQVVPEWASNAVRYEWSDDFGDVGPESKELEEILFGDAYKMTEGAKMEVLVDARCNVDSYAKANSMTH